MARRAARSRAHAAIDRPGASPRHAVLRPAPARHEWWADHAPLFAALVALLVYLPSLAGGFLYDDIHVVVDNRRIRDLSALGTVLRYEPARPVLSLTWAINYALGGLRPWPYHLVNVAIHAGNAALACSLFLWMARRAGRPPAGPAPPF